MKIPKYIPGNIFSFCILVTLSHLLKKIMTVYLQAEFHNQLEDYMKANQNKRYMLFAWLILGLFYSVSMAQTGAEVVNRIRENLNLIYPPNGPGSVVLAAKDGKIVLKQGFGLADKEKHVPLNSDHSLAVGSLTKQFTAMAIMILAEHEKLSLTDDITKYFPDVPRYKGITIHHLLTHTSGIKDYFLIDAWRKDLSENLSPQQTFDIIKKAELEFAPGEKVKYSNSGYHLLGMIAEQVSGQTLNDFIRKEILMPAEMNTTGFIDGPGGIMPSAKGYEKKNNEVAEASAISKTRFYAGGSLITTIEDLLKWDEILYSEKLVNKKTLNKYFTPFVLKNGDTSANACGWEVVDYQGLKIFGHGGGINGYVCQVYRVPKEHLYVAVLSNLVDRNSKHPVARTAREILISLLPENTLDHQVNSISLTPEEMSKYKGSYRLPDNSYRNIVVENGKVYYQQSETQKAELIPESETTFRAGKASKIIFAFDNKGEVTQFTISSGSGKTVTGIKEK